jgi:trk system potassium uptake protein TrkA
MKIIIIGCGRMGSGLARTMSLRGHAVTVVDRDPMAFERLGPAFKGQTVVGIGFDRDVLLKAGIDRADGLAALTESDEANVVAARLASQVFHIPRVVARLYDPRKADIYKRLGLRTIAPVAWGITRAADLLSRSQLEPVANLGGDVEIVEVEVPPLLVGRTVNELVVPGEIDVVAVSRGGRTLLPTLGTLFRDGDMVYVAVLSTSADRLTELLGLA